MAEQPHAVVAYPRFSDRDTAWVESVRKDHDPQCAMIRAHFTLVFPVAVLTATLFPEVEKAVVGQPPFRIEITRAVAHRDASASRSHVFLVPSVGGEEIDALHQRLYEGALRPHRRPEIPYVPHVTVAQKASYAECLELADTLSRRRISLGGLIDQIHVVSVAADAVTNVGAFDLGRLAFGGPS
jgi:2'-5' RNA ligase